MSAREVAPPGQPAGSAAQGGVQVGGSALAIGSGVLGLVVFMLQNRDDVTLTFLFWDFTWPLWLLVLVAAGLGSLVWIGLGVLRRRRRRVARRDARR